MDQFINSTLQSGGWEIFHVFGTCANYINILTFSGYDKLQAETFLIPPEKTKLIEGKYKWISYFFVGTSSVDILNLG